MRGGGGEVAVVFGRGREELFVGVRGALCSVSQTAVGACISVVRQLPITVCANSVACTYCPVIANW